MLSIWMTGCDSPDVEVSETPIEVASEQIGRGRQARQDDVVAIDYRVCLPDGSELLREKDFRFTLGRGAVISGIDEAVDGMRVGGRRTVICPPHKHWGRAGYGDGAVPPHTDLTIHIKLVSIE
jgi:FKBP-type peptidyl-prolyl cis-trans isomerase